MIDKGPFQDYNLDPFSKIGFNREHEMNERERELCKRDS